MKKFSFLIFLLLVCCVPDFLKAEVSISEDGKTLMIKNEFSEDPKALADIIQKNVNLREVQIFWNLPKKVPEFDKLHEVTRGWGNHIESLSIDVSINYWLTGFGTEAPSQCFNWLATLCPRIKSLTYKTEYLFPVVPSSAYSVFPAYSCKFPDLTAFKLIGYNADETYVLEQFLSGMWNLKELDLDLGPWTGGSAFIALIKEHVPNIEKIVIRDFGILQDPNQYTGVNFEVSNLIYYPTGITPNWEDFQSLSELTNIRHLHLGVLREARGIDLQFLNLPKMEYLRLRGIKSLSLQEMNRLVSNKPELKQLNIGGSRHNFKRYVGDGTSVKADVILEPHYCKFSASPHMTEIISNELEVLNLDFVSDLCLKDLNALVYALPNLKQLEFRNCPEVNEELIAELQTTFPSLQIIGHPDLQFGIIDSWTSELNNDD